MIPGISIEFARHLTGYIDHDEKKRQVMRILLTNDDGIRAKGLKHLWKSLIHHTEITIVAPSWEKSGSALSTTFTKPLYLEKN